MEWLKYPDNKPEKNGYYLTKHLLEGKIFYKAFWWTGEKWLFRYDPDVFEYWPVWHEFYCPCQSQFGM